MSGGDAGAAASLLRSPLKTASTLLASAIASAPVPDPNRMLVPVISMTGALPSAPIVSVPVTGVPARRQRMPEQEVRGEREPVAAAVPPHVPGVDGLQAPPSRAPWRGIEIEGNEDHRIELRERALDQQTPRTAARRRGRP